MDEFFYKDTDGLLTKRNDSSSDNTPTTYHSVDSSQEEPQHDFDFFNLNKPSTQAERRAGRRAQKNRGLSGLPKKWSSTSALSSSSRRDRYAGMNDDSRLLSSNGFANISPPPYSHKRAHSPRLFINRRLSPKSPSSARMKLVPSSKKSPADESAGLSPFSRREKVNESITDALANLPPAPTMPIGRPLTPGESSRKTLLKSDDYQRMSNSMSNLKLHSSDDSTPVASHFKHKSGMGSCDVFELDPFDDSHSLGEVNDFSTGDEDDDDFFSGNKKKSGDSHSVASKSLGSKSMNSGSATSVKKTKTSSSTWDQFIAKNEKKSKKYDNLESDVEEMRKSMHEQEKEMERELQKRDDIIRRLTEQLEVGKGSYHNSKADGQDSDEKKSKSKDKIKNKSDHGKSKKGSKMEKHRDTDNLSGKRTKQKRRGSAGVLEGAKREKLKRRGSTGLLDGKKSPRKEKRSGPSKKEKEAAIKETLAMLLGDAPGPPIERSDSRGSIRNTKRRGSGTSVPSLKSTTSTRSRKSSSDAKRESKEKKKKAKLKKSKAVDE
jgi:hypothetical protein